jgi:uncharacterized protein (DUF2267 family)
MSSTGLEVFDKTVQTTDAWLNEIMEVIGPDRHRAYRVLAAVLHSLRDRLTVNEAAQLGAQLPILVRGIYYDRWHDPAGKPERLRHKEEFLTAVADELDDIGLINPEQATRPLELVGVGATPDHDRSALGYPHIALSQDHTVALGQIDQLLQRAMA